MTPIVHTAHSRFVDWHRSQHCARHASIPRARVRNSFRALSGTTARLASLPEDWARHVCPSSPGSGECCTGSCTSTARGCSPLDVTRLCNTGQDPCRCFFNASTLVNMRLQWRHSGMPSTACATYSLALGLEVLLTTSMGWDFCRCVCRCRISLKYCPHT